MLRQEPVYLERFHNEATLLLMEKLEEAGIKGFVGKVNMDRNSPDYLCEASAAQSAKDTEEWIKASKQFEISVRF